MNWFSSMKLSGPDGIEAWTVALAACVISFVNAGLARMSGILYVDFIDIYHIDRRDASLPFSVRSSMRNLFGPVVGILGQKYGARPVALTGAIIGALGAGICYYAENILWVTVLWGGICGVGASLATTLTQAVIGQHFKKHRTTAAGIAFSGGCVGSFLFPVLLEYLLDTFGVQGTFLLISGILMHVIPATLLLRKPKWLKKQKSEVQISVVSDKVRNLSNMQQQIERKNIVHKIANVSHIKQKEFSAENEKDNSQKKTDSVTRSIKPVCNSQINFTSNINKDVLWDNRHFIINLLLRNSEEKLLNLKTSQRMFSTEDNEVTEIEEIFNKMLLDVCNDETIIENFFSDTTIFESGENSSTNGEDKYSSKNIQTNNDLKLCISELSSVDNFKLLNFLSITLQNVFEADMKNIVNIFLDTDMEKLHKIFDELRHVYISLNKNTERDTNNETVHSNSFYSHIMTACKLYTKPIFLLICLCRTTHMLTVMPLFTTLVDFYMDKGLPKEDGKYVIAALSLGDLLGRLCLGWISDRGYVTLPKFMMIGMIFQGAFLASLSAMYSKVTVLPVIAACGLFQGSLFVRHPVLVNRYLEKHEQSIAMGCLNFFAGLLAFVLPVYIGFFRDVIGSYNGILYINGAIAALIGLLWGFEKNIVNLSEKRKENAQVRL